MTKRQKRTAAIAAISVAVAVGAYLVWFLRPRDVTIAQALHGHPELFPGTQRLLSPLSSTDRLGFRFELDAGVTGIGVPEPAPCFLVRPESTGPSTSLRVTYHDQASMKLELASVFASLGLNASDLGATTAELRGLRVARAVGVPNPNGPCNFQKTPRVDVISTEVIADGLSVNTGFTHSADFAGDAALGAGKSGAASSGWQATGSGSIEGSNIAVSGSTRTVQVTITGPDRHDLGNKPHLQIVPLPTGLDGHITVLAFEQRTDKPTLTIQPEGVTSLGAPPLGDGGVYQSCAVDTASSLDFGRRCFFWLSASRAVGFWWDLEKTGDVEHVVTHSIAYQSEFVN